MTLRECYSKLGGDYEAALEQMCDDSLISQFLLRFKTEGTMDSLRKAVADNDITASFKAAHTLKGLSANLALTSLNKAAYELTEQLRPCEEPADPLLMDLLEAQYQQTIRAIESYESELEV